MATSEPKVRLEIGECESFTFEYVLLVRWSEVSLVFWHERYSNWFVELAFEGNVSEASWELLHSKTPKFEQPDRSTEVSSGVLEQ